MEALHDYGAVTLALVPNKGRGILANRDFAVGEIILVSPVVIFPESDLPALDSTLLGEYYFHWPYDEDGAPSLVDRITTCLPLGLGSLVNSSDSPNAHWEFDGPKRLQLIRAAVPIRGGEEILINYCWQDEKTKKLTA